VDVEMNSQSQDAGLRRRAATVAVVGAGHVGAAVTTTLALRASADRVVLYNRRLSRAEGEVWDLADAAPLLHDVQLVATDDWRDVAGADAVVVTAGRLVRAGQSRLDEDNGPLIRDVMARLDAVAPDAVVLIVTNPVDVMTRLAQDSSARAPHLVLGAGTVLDAARLRHGLAAVLGVDPHNTHVHVLGEHGDRSFVAWSSATVGPVPLASFPLPPAMRLRDVQESLAARMRRRGPVDILTRKGHTSAGIAAAASRILESVLRDQRRIFTVSARALPEYGIGERVVLGLPSVVGRQGVVSRLPLALDAAEQRLLERSAAVVEAAYERLAAAPVSFQVA
jgi:L-lactate dehydrogenase